MEEIVGRDVELDAVETLLETLTPSVLLLAGEAGIGKTTLWRAAVTRARERDMRVLVSAPTESEARLSYTGLGDVTPVVVTSPTAGFVNSGAHQVCVG